MLTLSPRAASSVHLVNRGPVSDDPSTAQQTHRPAHTNLHRVHVASVSADVSPPRHDPTHSDSHRPGGDLFLADACNRRVLLGSPRPSCSGWQDSGTSPSPGPDRARRNSVRHDGLPTGLEGDEGHEFPPHGPSMYHRMMNYIDSVFEDAMGQRFDLERPVAQGTSTSRTRKGPILLGRAQPVRVFMKQADSAYLKANEKKPTSVGYPSGRFAKIYGVAGQEVYRKAALVNPSLHAALHCSAREPCVLREHPEVARMEGVVARSRDTLNYSFWCSGDMHLLAARHLPALLLDLEEQLFKAVCMALNDACRDSTYVITNLRAWRREAYLGRLRPFFLQVEKGILRRSPIFTPLLFDEACLQEALQSSKSNADRTLHEAALRALAWPHPAPGMPLVEHGPRPTSTTVRSSAAPVCRPSFAARTRDSWGGVWWLLLVSFQCARRGTEGKACLEVTPFIPRGQLRAV
ncbi:hypothetical protein E2C01_061460 [Portunus trituberculatus]|uniref:Uncharacterized protein n=1 Tax=Portunus trituberculatus TaxID=210409 RepID=A0A5B7HD87_PORTR|nr:hypothetical protein [Portunus trituberculatus]